MLKGISLEFKSGGIFAVLGPNGSGKTTIIKSLLGMVLPDSGEIFIDDVNIKNNSGYRSKLDYLPQIARFPENITMAEVINMIIDVRGQPSRHMELLDLFDLKNSLNEKLGNLSGGTRQKVNIVLTFMFNNPIIILDEPTSGLDPVSLIKLKKLIGEEKERGKLIIMTTHIIGLVEELADEIVFLLEGKIYFRGTADSLIQNNKATNLEEAIAAIISDNNEKDI